MLKRTVFVDADQMGVGGIPEKEAMKREQEIIYVCGNNNECHPKYGKVIYVEQGKNSADNKIISMAKKGDIVYTGDGLLAVLLNAKGCIVYNRNGRRYMKVDEERILQGHWWDIIQAPRSRRSNGNGKKVK